MCVFGGRGGGGMVLSRGGGRIYLCFRFVCFFLLYVVSIRYKQSHIKITILALCGIHNQQILYVQIPGWFVT